MLTSNLQARTTTQQSSQIYFCAVLRPAQSKYAIQPMATKNCPINPQKISSSIINSQKQYQQFIPHQHDPLPFKRPFPHGKHALQPASPTLVFSPMSFNSMQNAPRTEHYHHLSHSLMNYQNLNL